VIDSFRNIIERYSFGVCTALAQKMGLKTGVVRMYFIYLSFITMGSPLVIYLIAGFWLNIKTYLRKGKNIVFE